MSITDMIFYINIALMFCVAAEFAVLCLMRKRTAYMRGARRFAICALGAGLSAFAVQLVTRALLDEKSGTAIYVALALMCLGLATAAAYCLLLSRRSNKALAVFAALFGLVPPFGTVFVAMLLSRMPNDTIAEELIYRGRCCTYAVLTSIFTYADADYLDSSETQDEEKVDAKSVRKHLNRLKKEKKTPEGCFKYAEGLLEYSPKDHKYAVKLMQKAANRGNADALYNLGYFCERGAYGEKKDLKRARAYYKRAADAGDADAELRLGILDIKTKNAAVGTEIFDKRADTDDVVKYDLALCYERGDGVPCDMDKAIELYCSCAEKGMSSARKRLLALAAEYAAVRRDGLKKIGGVEFDGEFGDIMRGMKEIHDGRAPEAAECFLSAVKRRGEWEGFARLAVGVLYIDCGALERDRRNGAAYVKTAVSSVDLAAEVYHAIPSRLKKPLSDRDRDSEPRKDRNHDGETKKASSDKAGADIVERDSISNTRFDANKNN